MGGLPNVCNVVVDSAGNVFAAAKYPYSGVYEYEALQLGSLAAMGALVDGSAMLGVDAQSHELFTDSTTAVTQYDTGVQPPSLEGSSGGKGAAGELSGSYGVAINHETGELYVGNSRKVEIFGGPEECPGRSPKKHGL